MATSGRCDAYSPFAWFYNKRFDFHERFSYGANKENAMFFDSWNGLLRVAVVGSLAYIALVVLLRISGKRTLSKMNAFDLVVTVAIGSTLATVLLTNQVALAEGVLALALLICLQFIVTWLSVRSSRFKRFVKAEPAMLFYRGMFLRGVMKKERVTEDEIVAAVRQQKIAELSEVEAVVLETDGTFSVVPKAGGEGPSSLQYVRNDREARAAAAQKAERTSMLSLCICTIQRASVNRRRNSIHHRRPILTRPQLDYSALGQCVEILQAGQSLMRCGSKTGQRSTPITTL